MKNVQIRLIMVGAILLLTGAFVHSFEYKRQHAVAALPGDISHIPLQFGENHGRDVSLDEKVYEILGTKLIIHRAYVSRGKQVFLSVVHFPTAEVHFHPPEGCLAATGVELERVAVTTRITTPKGNINMAVNQIVSEKQGHKDLVYYFYKSGHYTGSSYFLLRLDLAMNVFHSQDGGASLIRVSTPIADEKAETASGTLTDFLADLYPFIVEYL